MSIDILLCAAQNTSPSHCQLSQSCRGWGCKFLTTPIEDYPYTAQEKAKLFSRVYREAKSKGVLQCPFYRSIFIDEILDTLPETDAFSDKIIV